MGAKCIRPLLKQSFVTAGVSINVAIGAIVLGFANGLMEQLKAPGSNILIQESSESWIAAMPTFTMCVGNIIVIPIMGNYRRRYANLISIAVIFTAWTCIIFSTCIELLLFARALQGIHLGMSITLGSLLIGEYTSPKNRGFFLMSISILISVAYLTVHSIGSYIRWQNAAIVSAAISFINFIIAYYSPESPSWLACQGRYEDSRRVFRWLRGDGEEEELRKIIEVNVLAERSREVEVSLNFVKKVQKRLIYFSIAFKHREFYVPVMIMLHMYAIITWGGMYILTVYSSDFFRKIVGCDSHLPILLITIDIQRVVVNIIGIYIIQKVKRRTMLLFSVGINIVTLLAIGAYNYARENNSLPYDHPMIPILLSHCLMFAIAVGTLPLSYVISGEIFPLESKNLAGGLSNIACSMFSFLSVKTIPNCFNIFGIHGTFCIYVLVLTYSLVIVWILLPETKNRTLQDIEDELKGRPVTKTQTKD